MADETVIILTGAPDADTLTFDDLPSQFGLRHRRFLQDEDQDETTQDSLALATQSLARWREVPLHGQEKPGNINAHPPDTTFEATQFLSFLDDPAHQNAEHMAFLERSLYALQNLDSSQIGIPEDTVYDESTFVTGASFNTTLSTDLSLQPSRDSLSSYVSDNPEQQTIDFNGPITDLRRIPNAQHLKSIHPQTMTINILAGVITMQPTRTVSLRKRIGEMDIVEVLVGDEGKAGFNISFWLPPIDSQAHRTSAHKSPLRDILQGLRAGDLILVTHIALGEFKNNVFGQSLSRRITRNNTAITVLSQHVTGLPPPVMAKLNKVREWGCNFIGKKNGKRMASPNLATDFASKRRMKHALPPDTQPGQL